MAQIRCLAFDFGASSGRVLRSEFDGHDLSVREIHRFQNDPVYINGTLYWDVLRLLFEMKQGITKALVAGGFDSIGIDTWGVDFGLLDNNGRLLENPVHYRDERTIGIPEEVFKIIPRAEIYRQTGNQTLRFNTLYQLFYLSRYRKDLMERADSLLFMPDLFAYLLTGVKRVEYSIASTSQMLSPRTGTWCDSMLERLGICIDILPPVIDAGMAYGNLGENICRELGCPAVPVIAVCTHDTASAVASIPALDEDYLYISSGTWSLMGTVNEAPILTQSAMEQNIANEGGFKRTIGFLKNIMGLWLISETRRQWIREGKEISFAELEELAGSSIPFVCFIDPDRDEFAAPGDLPARICDFCQRTGQTVPQSKGEIIRCIYDSIAMKYRFSMNSIKQATGKHFPVIHIIGGGTKDRLLCQMTADSCDIPVLAGPIEATGIGNIAVQMIALGALNGLDDVRKMIRETQPLLAYTPQNAKDYDYNYQRFISIIQGDK